MSQNKSGVPMILQDQLIGDQKVIKKLICGKCQHMLMSPLMCNRCMNIWCEKCCNDKQYLPQSACPNHCEDIQFLKSPPLLDELFKIIKIKCFFHKNKDEPQFVCNKVLDYNEYEYHYYTCEFGYEKCEIKECQKLIKRKDAQEHKKVCPTREVLMMLIKEAHLKTISTSNTLNQITSLTDRVKKDNERLQQQLMTKSQKLEQVQQFQLNQCRKCLHVLSQQQDNR